MTLNLIAKKLLKNNINHYILLSFGILLTVSFVTEVGILGYGIGIIYLILIFIILNFMLSRYIKKADIITRKKELGMLQAIGLTDKQLIKMSNIEAMFYTSTMLISTLTLGTGLGYIAVQVFRRFGGSYAVYTFPTMQIIIMIVCIILAQLTLTYLISKNFNKESLIDRVRYSE